MNKQQYTMEKIDHQNMHKIDRSKIQTPIVELSKAALEQLALMKKHDYTLKNKCFRVWVSGKGCDGFTYAFGPTESRDDDIMCDAQGGDFSEPLAMDPFTAFYTKSLTIDYQSNPLLDEEGFILNNLQQESFRGKFWKDDATKIPPLTDTE